jgi:hypothetical protein
MPLDLFSFTGYRTATTAEVAPILAARHYLGPIRRGLAFAQVEHGEIVGCMVWSKPTSRMLPKDGTWLELSRWCLTPECGTYAGSRMHKAFTRWARSHAPNVTTFVSYSDPSAGHTGALYRACNWQWAPTWLRLRPPPSGNGSWSDGKTQAVKDRWVFPLRADGRRGEVLAVRDDALNPGGKPWDGTMRWAAA